MERISRRRLMQMMGGAAAAVAAAPKLFAMGGADLTLTKGPYAGTRPSLANYQMPEWFGEAKFGIWAH